MDFEIFCDGMTKEDIKDQEKTTACRGIIIKDNKYLVVNVEKFDITTFPGGRLEENETKEECCVREVLEETGFLCKVTNKVISVTEYFSDSIWTNIYFNCEIIEDTKKTNYTDEEKDLLMVTKWKTLDELLDTFENNMTKHPFGPNIHNREFLGLIHSL